MNDAATAPLRARISKGYRIRLALIGLGLTAFGCWALYDGFIEYPRRAEVYAQLQQMQEDHVDWATRWQAYAAERGLETNPNKVKPLEDKDIWTQYVMAAICLPIGGFFLLNFVRASGRKVEADALGIRGREGSATWDEVHGLDDARWRTKGISRVLFRDAGGAEGKIVLDDWKYEREPTVAIHARVAEKLGLEDGAAVPAEGAETPPPAEAAEAAEPDKPSGA
ncbi:hypothetical protein [Phycisphaera mikurensis]|uniref:Uncharacterized protein n=1 Tax=Phycisphaera mikurensis (strain NBRC 102666 / KCTC 22515 / FYK2301M01) TaxID=1142394 RepID=I0IDY6_PHYMF|nr:hypothetical protein [Phycisphaera mikurensis]MBB6441281.1 hypothetical protein [Phycisphaera mikurensis]BAM03474.1 hypothetical protein PSMK_13150 [Phycisphaera mikurensis NBRC 102666]